MDITYPINNWFPYRLKINFRLNSSLPILIYGNDNATNELFDWKRNMLHFFYVVYQAMTWGSDENASPQQSINISFFAFTWKPFEPSKRKPTSRVLYNVTNTE